METSQTGIIFNIQRYTVHDGPGIRVTVFFKGCPMRCCWCHNPEGLKKKPETVVQKVILDGNPELSEKEIVGKTMALEEVMQEIEKDLLFFDESGGGVTFSGGEPLMQHEFLKALLERCKEQEIHTALDTTGYAPSEIFQTIIDQVDLFLYDLKLINDDLHRKHTGISNALTLKNLHMLSEQGKKIWIRFPIIPNITDTKENILDILEMITHLNGIEQINLLPYHRIAEGKYQKLQLLNKMTGVMPPSIEQLETLKHRFEQSGIPVKIGG